MHTDRLWISYNLWEERSNRHYEHLNEAFDHSKKIVEKAYESAMMIRCMREEMTKARIISIGKEKK